MGRHVVCPAQELEQEGRRVLALGVRRILVLRTEEGDLHALSNRCPHQGAPLDYGRVEQMWIGDELGDHHHATDRVVIVCPWHNYETDVRTGCSTVAGDKFRAQIYRVEVEDDEIVVYV